MKRTLKPGPGVLVGVSTDRAYKASAVFYNGDKRILELDLSEAMPSVITSVGVEPGLDLQMFCSESIRVEHPDYVEMNVFVD